MSVSNRILLKQTVFNDGPENVWRKGFLEIRILREFLNTKHVIMQTSSFVSPLGASYRLCPWYVGTTSPRHHFKFRIRMDFILYYKATVKSRSSDLHINERILFLSFRTRNFRIRSELLLLRF